MIHPEIYIHPNRVPSEFCKTIIESYEYAVEQKPSDFGYQSGHDFGVLERKDMMGFADDLDLRGEFNGEMSSIINQHLNEALLGYAEIFEGLKKMQIRSIRQKLQKTVPGGGYHLWHHEQDHINTSERVLTWTIYLNDIEEGGETEFLYQSKRIKAEEGKIVLFPATYTHSHRGNPPLSDTKYIATGWYVLY